MSDLAKRLIDAAEPRYTLAEAIDKILDGLSLDWVEKVTDHKTTREYSATGSKTTYRVIQFHDRVVAILPTGNELCESVEYGKKLCEAFDRALFRAEIERAVKKVRLDSEGRDVTNLPGLWDESDTFVSELDQLHTVDWLIVPATTNGGATMTTQNHDSDPICGNCGKPRSEHHVQPMPCCGINGRA